MSRGVSREAVLEMKERFYRLCRAPNSLPETQGRRVEAHFLLGISIKEITEADGTGERNIRKSIYRGLTSMKKHLKTLRSRGPKRPQSEVGM